MRPSGRAPDQLRPVTLTRHYTRHAEGAVLVEFGDTKVLCTASVDNTVPRFLKGKGEGWITAEYGMLPRSTHTRSDREAARGKQGGRTLEIQRLIGRSLRACVDLKKLGENTITIDCDVIQADGGTRTASITGGCVALVDALSFLLQRKAIKQDPLLGLVAAVSVGMYEGAGFVRLFGKTGRRRLPARIMDGDLRLTQSSANFQDTLGRARIRGNISALFDDVRAREMLLDAQREFFARSLATGATTRPCG